MEGGCSGAGGTFGRWVLLLLLLASLGHTHSARKHPEDPPEVPCFNRTRHLDMAPSSHQMESHEAPPHLPRIDELAEADPYQEAPRGRMLRSDKKGPSKEVVAIFWAMIGAFSCLVVLCTCCMYCVYATRHERAKNKAAFAAARSRLALLNLAGSEHTSADSAGVVQVELVTVDLEKWFAVKESGPFTQLAKKVPLPVPDLTVRLRQTLRYQPSAATQQQFAVLESRVTRLETSDLDFIDYVSLFTSQMLTPVTITAVHRIEPPKGRMAAFEGACEDLIAARGTANVRLVWHGSSLAGILAIARQGFALATHVHGSTLGKGVYFGAQAALSAAYAQKDERGEQHIVLAMVALGRSEVPKPEQFMSSGLGQFDSGVDNLVTPNQFVVWSNFFESVCRLCVISFKVQAAAAGFV